MCPAARDVSCRVYGRFGHPRFGFFASIETWPQDHGQVTMSAVRAHPWSRPMGRQKSETAALTSEATIGLSGLSALSQSPPGSEYPQLTSGLAPSATWIRQRREVRPRGVGQQVDYLCRRTLAG